MQKIKKIFHLFVESKDKNASEFWYFQLLDRKFDNVTFSLYHKEQAFIKEARKKKTKSDEFFIAVLDSDVDYNNLQISITARTKKITTIASSAPNIQVYMSSRCWENWLVNHFRIFNQHTNNGTSFPIPDYVKKKDWYTKNQQVLLSSLDQAIDRCKEQRNNVYRNKSISIPINDLPDFSQHNICLNIVANCNPISYIDLLFELVIRENVI